MTYIIVVKITDDCYEVLSCEYDTITHNRSDQGGEYGSVYRKLTDRADAVVDAIHEEYGDRYHGSLSSLKEIISDKLRDIRSHRRSLRTPTKPSKIKLEPFDVTDYY